MKKSALILGVLVPISWSTTLAVVWTPDKVAIAADSMIIRTERSAGGVRKLRQYGCKIQKVEGVFYGLTGLYEDVRAGFDARRIIESEFPRGHSFESRTQIAMIGLLRGLSRSWKAGGLSVAKDANYQQTGVVFVGRDDGVLKVWADMRALRENFAGGFVFEGTYRQFPDPNDPDKHYGWVVVGSHVGIDKEIASGHISELDPAEMAEGLVQTEIDTQAGLPSPTVGRPISVLVFDKDGVRWAKRGVCHFLQ
jgi:hypothetical protein